MKPTCLDFPGTVYCQETNTCEAATDCPLYGSIWRSSSVSRKMCSNTEVFCIHKATCVPADAVESFPGEQQRYSTNLNAVQPPRYEEVHRIQVKPTSFGYNYFDQYNIVSDPSLARPLLMEVGYVLALVVPDAGVHVAYEIPADDEPSEIGVNGWTEIRKRHLLRATLSQPLVTTFNSSLVTLGVHVVSAVMNSSLAEGALAQVEIELSNDPISGSHLLELWAVISIYVDNGNQNLNGLYRAN